ncbi:putative gustatory receptor 94a [Anopheles aquasalis]|uniref:putative gustatory receptor 94a n=1 Tax=Anopheles aquasalis TaxID=42839 RepID=UPI00215A2856|nr:putative gustatory receptor 94a [Anopheles aquasalis]
MISEKVFHYLLIIMAVQATVFGMLTLRYDRRKRELCVSKLLVVYSICLTVGFAITYQSTLFLLAQARFRSGYKLTLVHISITAVQGQVVMYSFISSAVRRYRKRFDVALIMKELQQLQHELFNENELKQHWNKLLIRKMGTSQLILISGFVLGVTELLQRNSDDNVYEEIGLLIVFYYPKIAIQFSISMYFGVIMFLQNLHYALNERLKVIVYEHEEDCRKMPLRGYTRTQRAVYLRSKLDYICLARCRIATCCRKVHGFYERMLLSSSFLCMTFIIYQLYLFFEIFYMHFQAETNLSVVGLLHEAMTCVFCFFEIYSMAQACEAVRHQVIAHYWRRKPALQIFSRLCCPFQSRKMQTLLLRLNVPKMDHKLKQCIEVFALQTLHQPIEFTACNMFILDYTVLFSIIASVTNYLIILVQFELATEK